MATQSQDGTQGALVATMDEWLAALESPGQREQLKVMIAKASPEKAAEAWIMDAYRPTRRAMKDGRREGPGPDGATVFSRLKAEFDKFMCGHKDYDKVRNGVLSAFKKGRSALVAALAGVIAKTIAVSAAVLAPAIVALLIAMGAIGQAAYCKGVKLKDKK